MTSLIIMFAVRPICVQDSIFKMSSESPVSCMHDIKSLCTYRPMLMSNFKSEILTAQEHEERLSTEAKVSLPLMNHINWRRPILTSLHKPIKKEAEMNLLMLCDITKAIWGQSVKYHWNVYISMVHTEIQEWISMTFPWPFHDIFSDLFK